ncbi:kinase-like domain-containing protein [Dunaliella salina]|uniref:Kinase-like domain-containing protein n=1 Tax=Dunaliella salina TaxID=3046 RepID=A0ABQ7H4Z0_DUNSA|nr:kinase-like domain-containing protein [Dunaliella salina]|eukprot:KAF5841916.1 kinase-like domain-containing protein [Dunaliella salina]
MSFFKRLFDKKPVQTLQLGAEKHAHHSKHHGTAAHEASSSDSDDDGTLSCPQLSSPVTHGQRRGGLDAGITSTDIQHHHQQIHEPPRKSRTWGGREDFSGGIGAVAMSRLSTSSSDYSPDDKLRAGYKRVSRSHRGRNSTILAATDRATGRPVAIKVFMKETTTSFKLQKMHRETSVLKTTSGIPGVVRLLNVLEDQNSYYTILEALPGCTLIELMACRGGRLNEQQCAIEVAIPLLTALAGLHEIGVVHRDIKPEHVLCTYGSICLLDFVESAVKSEKNLNHRAGQMEYCAPEVLNKPMLTDVFHQVLYHGMSEEELPQYDEKADLWSAGVLLYEALTGQQPFMADNVRELTLMHQQQLSQKNASGIPLFLANQKLLTPLTQQFIAAMLQVDPTARPSAHQMLQHPWLQAHLGKPASAFLLPTAPCNLGNLAGASRPSRLGHSNANGHVQGVKASKQEGVDARDKASSVHNVHPITAQ